MKGISKRKQNNIIIGGLLVIVLLMVVGYAAFASKLSISGTSNITSNWDIEIISVESKNIIGEASNATNPTLGGLNATFNAKLVSPGDSITYDSSITSQPSSVSSTINATLDFVQNTSGTITPITKITINDLKNLTVTTGDGLYKDTYETGRYIYKGANPNNYITLGNDTYRIISIETDGTIKVIKNSSIGNMVFDPGYSTSITGVTDVSSINGTRYSSVSTDYCYSHSNLNYYGCKVWGSKTTMLDSNGNNITKMPQKIKGTTYDLPESEAYKNTYLNKDWYNSLDSSVKNKITTHMFNVGVVNSNETNFLSTLDEESSYKWKGNIGLVNASDYVKANTNIELCKTIYQNTSAAENYSTCKMTNWLFKSSYFWTITSSSDSSASPMFLVSNVGSLGTNGAYDINGINPVFYLSSNITLTGEGTSSNPYTLSGN